MTVYMLSGKKAFDDRDVPKMIEQRNHNDEFLAGRLAALAVSEPVTEVVLHACHSKAEERYPSVDDFWGAMRGALRGGGADHNTTSRFEKLDPEEVHDIQVESAQPLGEGVLISSLQPGEIVAAGRRLKLIAATDEHIDVESQLMGPQGALRFRLTLLPVQNGQARLHVKGLNCFVAKAGGRTSNAVDVETDVEVKVMSADRKPAGDIRCTFGQPNGETRVFGVGTGSIAIPNTEASHTVLLDFGSTADALLLYKAKRGAR
jgi:hypothetical protein